MTANHTDPNHTNAAARLPADSLDAAGERWCEGFPARFTVDDVPSPYLVACAALRWCVDAAPELLQHGPAALDDTRGPIEAHATATAAREQLLAGLVALGRHAVDDAAVNAAEVCRPELRASQLETARRAFYFARWLHAALAYDTIAAALYGPAGEALARVAAALPCPNRPHTEAVPQTSGRARRRAKGGAPAA